MTGQAVDDVADDDSAKPFVFALEDGVGGVEDGSYGVRFVGLGGRRNSVGWLDGASGRSGKKGGMVSPWCRCTTRARRGCRHVKRNEQREVSSKAYDGRRTSQTHPGMQ